MKLIRNIAIVATLASVFAFASCGTTQTAKNSTKKAAQEVVDTTVNAAVEETTNAIDSAADKATDALSN